jgi:hypothetical protein
MGPTDEAVLVQSWSEYQAQFGGLYPNVYLGYAVNQFFGNGGSQAYIVRLVDGAVAADSAHGTGFTIGGLTVYAQNPGKWGSSIWVSVSISPADTSRFGITVQQTPVSGGSPVTVETWPNLSFNPSDPQGRYVVAVIDNDSNYISFINPASPTTLPGTPSGAPAALSSTQLANGSDGTIIYPNDGNFETALNINGSVSGGGIPLLDGVFFNLLCVPGETKGATISALQSFCQSPDNRAFYIVDCQSTATFATLNTNSGPLGSDGTAITTEPQSANSAFYFPWVSAPDPLAGNRPALFPPCGYVAGVYAATDASRGVVEGSGRHRRGPQRHQWACCQSERLTERQSQHPCHQLPAQFPGLRQRGVGSAHARRQQRRRLAVAVRSHPPLCIIPRVEPLPRHAVGRL